MQPKRVLKNRRKLCRIILRRFRIREQLSATAKQDTSIRRDLAEVWMKIGDVLEMTGARAQALENYRKATETLEALSTAIPADAVIRGMLAEARRKRAQ